MKFIALLCFLISASFVNTNAYAEGNCPQGQFPIGGGNGGWTGCAPIPGYWDNQQQPASPPPPQWSDRYGAMASASNGALGSVTGMSNKELAEQAAITDCQGKGGANCKLEISYVNGCAALVVDDAGYSFTANSTKDKAIAVGMKTCTNAGAINCRVYYSACSPPARIR